MKIVLNPNHILQCYVIDFEVVVTKKEPGLILNKDDLFSIPMNERIKLSTDCPVLSQAVLLDYAASCFHNKYGIENLDDLNISYLIKNDKDLVVECLHSWLSHYAIIFDIKTNDLQMHYKELFPMIIMLERGLIPPSKIKQTLKLIMEKEEWDFVFNIE